MTKNQNKKIQQEIYGDIGHVTCVLRYRHGEKNTWVHTRSLDKSISLCLIENKWNKQIVLGNELDRLVLGGEEDPPNLEGLDGIRKSPDLAVNGTARDTPGS